MIPPQVKEKKSMRKTSTFSALVAVVLAALVFVGTPPPARAQSSYDAALARILNGQAAGLARTTDDTDVAILIRFTGTSSGGGTVAVAANGDLTLSTGAVGASAVDTTVKCPSGGSSGVIDVSDTACDTLGEVVDIINASSNWKAVILDGLRSDSSNDTLLTISETAANAVNGLELKWDTDVALKSTIAVLPSEARVMPFYLQGRTLKTDPYAGQMTLFWFGNGKSTYASGTSTITLTSVRATNNPLTFAGTETVTTLLSTAGGATTANQDVDWRSHGIWGKRNEKLLFRITNSAAMATVSMSAVGRTISAQ